MLCKAFIQWTPLCPAKRMIIKHSDTVPGLSHHQHPTTSFPLTGTKTQVAAIKQTGCVWQHRTEIRQSHSRKLEEAALPRGAWMREDFPGRRRAIGIFQNLFLGLDTTQSAPQFPACKATRKNKTFSHFHVSCQTTFGILKVSVDIQVLCHVIRMFDRYTGQPLC